MPSCSYLFHVVSFIINFSLSLLFLISYLVLFYLRRPGISLSQHFTNCPLQFCVSKIASTTLNKLLLFVNFQFCKDLVATLEAIKCSTRRSFLVISAKYGWCHSFGCLLSKIIGSFKRHFSHRNNQV